MRERIREMIAEARRPPRTAADPALAGHTAAERLAAEAIRLARLAAALHLSQAAGLLRDPRCAPADAEART